MHPHDEFYILFICITEEIMKKFNNNVQQSKANVHFIEGAMYTIIYRIVFYVLSEFIFHTAKQKKHLVTFIQDK